MISIIIPTYNEEKYIEKTLAQLKKLTLPHEIIVTDDRSADSTVAIAKKYADQVLCPPQKHSTIAANRNAGAAVARGDFLVFIDGDSYIAEPDSFFTEALETFSSRPNLVGLTVALRALPELETPIDRIVFASFNLVHRLKNNVLHVGEAIGKFQMIRREAFDKIGGFRSDLVTREDGDMFYRLSKIGQTYCDPKLTVFHTARRAHAFGWPKLLWIWTINTFWFAAFGSVITKVWKPVR